MDTKLFICHKVSLYCFKFDVEFNSLQSISQNIVSVIFVVNFDVTMGFPLKFLHLRSILHLRTFVKTGPELLITYHKIISLTYSMLPEQPKTFSYALSNEDRVMDIWRNRSIISIADPLDLTPASLQILLILDTCQTNISTKKNKNKKHWFSDTLILLCKQCSCPVEMSE